MLKQIISLKEVCAQTKENGLVIMENYIQFLLIQNTTLILNSWINFAKLKKNFPGTLKL